MNWHQGQVGGKKVQDSFSTFPCTAAMVTVTSLPCSFSSGLKVGGWKEGKKVTGRRE